MTNIKFIFMSFIVLGLIVNTASFSDLAFADKPEKEAKEDAKKDREDAKKEAKEAREDAKKDREELREDAEKDREEIKEFNDDVVITSSSTTSTEKVTICHIPPGNPANAHTITVGSPAVAAHKAHGDFVYGSCDDEDFDLENYESKKESRISEDSDKESKALERALKLIEKLEQQISNLEERLQNLLNKYESGEYYGNISESDAVTNSYAISFDGAALSIYDKDVTTEMSGELFMENQVTKSDTSKFKILSGEVKIGDIFYDVVFGKARLSSTDQGDSLVVVLQTIDSEENDNTIKITLGFNAPLEGEFGNPTEGFEILDNSRISGQWNLDGTGKLSLES